MSNKQEHIDRAVKNEGFASLLTDPYWDWAVTATYYAGVHYIEAYFANLRPPIHSGTHGTRDSDIRRDSVLNAAWRTYKHMKEDSEDARYEPHIPFDANSLAKQRKRLEDLKIVVHHYL